MPARVAVEASHSGGVHKILVVWINARHLITQGSMLFQDILLVVIFGHRKGPDRYHVGFDGMAYVLLKGSLGRQCLLTLLFVMVKDRRHVLPRPGSPGRHVAFPENVKQLSISDALRIIVHLDGLGVITHLSVGRCIHPAAGIAYACTYYPFNDPELGFDSPESAKAKGGCFKNSWRGHIDRWNLGGFGFKSICKVHGALLCIGTDFKIAQLRVK